MAAEPHGWILRWLWPQLPTVEDRLLIPQPQLDRQYRDFCHSLPEHASFPQLVSDLYPFWNYYMPSDSSELAGWYIDYGCRIARCLPKKKSSPSTLHGPGPRVSVCHIQRGRSTRTGNSLAITPENCGSIRLPPEGNIDEEFFIVPDTSSGARDLYDCITWPAERDASGLHFLPPPTPILDPLSFLSSRAERAPDAKSSLTKEDWSTLCRHFHWSPKSADVASFDLMPSKDFDLLYLLVDPESLKGDLAVFTELGHFFSRPSQTANRTSPTRKT